MGAGDHTRGTITGVRTYLDCYPCFLRQALTAARMAGATEAMEWEVVHHVLGLVRDLPEGATPPELVDRVHRLVRELVDSGDPYAAVKSSTTAAALALYPRLKDLVASSADPFATAVRVAIAGNVIDLGVADDVPDLWATVERVLAAPLAGADLEALRAALASADHVLYLADNAGETVFDRVLIEALPVPVVYAVKGGPVLNDATRDDAEAAGLSACATLTDTGSDAPGTTVWLCSEQFRSAFAGAPVVIAKGQANYETLSDAGPRVFCLLQVKCPVIARDAEAPVGSVLVRRSTWGDVRDGAVHRS